MSTSWQFEIWLEYFDGVDLRLRSTTFYILYGFSRHKSIFYVWSGISTVVTATALLVKRSIWLGQIFFLLSIPLWYLEIWLRYLDQLDGVE